MSCLVWSGVRQLGIEPQLYGLRWARLLFCREFAVPNLHRLWDPMLATALLRSRIKAGQLTVADAKWACPWTVVEAVEWIATALVRLADVGAWVGACATAGGVRIPLQCTRVCACLSTSRCELLAVACGFQLLHIRDRLIVDDYTEVLTALMRYPATDDPFQFFAAATALAESGGRVRSVTPPPVPPQRHSARSGDPSSFDVGDFRGRMIAFYQVYVVGRAVVCIGAALWQPARCAHTPRAITRHNDETACCVTATTRPRLTVLTPFSRGTVARKTSSFVTCGTYTAHHRWTFRRRQALRYVAEVTLHRFRRCTSLPCFLARYGFVDGSPSLWCAGWTARP